ncbi:MAG: glyoxylate/hydroxypyruvate reductase A, partial [Burkholderia gladioli]
MNDIIMLATRLPAGQEAEYRAALAAAMPAETIVPLREADAGGGGGGRRRGVGGAPAPSVLYK